MQSHDLSLPAWGPYTKRYSGISHVPAANDGVRFDLSVFPGMYRRRVYVPYVRFESGFHPWAAARINRASSPKGAKEMSAYS